MKDLVRVKVLEATKGHSKVTDQPTLTLKLEPLETILLHDEEVGYLFTTISDGDNEGTRGWRQAQLRYVLGLDPYYLASEKLMTPEFTKTELHTILGKEFLAAIDITNVPDFGEKLRVLDFYRLP